MSTIAAGLECELGDGTIIRPLVASSDQGYQGGIEIDGMFAKVPETFTEVDDAIEAAINAFDHWSRSFGGKPAVVEKPGQ